MASNASSKPSNANAPMTSDAALKTLEGQSSYIPSVISQWFGSAETIEHWQNYEQLITACLRIGDEKSAHGILARLVTRFGAQNERVMALRGLYQEAVADSRQSLETVLKEYDTILEENPANLPVGKRRVTLLRSLSRPEQAIESLVEMLRFSPTDVEAWCELADLYLTQGMYSQAVFSMEEGLLIYPNAWNLQAKLGEIFYMSSSGENNLSKSDKESSLVNSIRRFSRSVELCDGYLRGYYGLALATERYAATASSINAMLSPDEAQRLKQKAMAELRKIVNDRDSSYDAAELIAAKELLGETTASK